MMAKPTKKSKSASLLKRGNAKTMGDEPFDVDTPPPKKHKDAANRASKYFSTTNKKGYTVNPWSRGSKNFIDVVFHDGGVPVKSEEPNITLDEGGSALRVEWKLPEKLFTATQTTVQSILVDSSRYNGYCNTQDQMKAARVHPVEGCYRSVPQVVNLKHECTGVLKTLCFDVPANNDIRREWLAPPVQLDVRLDPPGRKGSPHSHHRPKEYGDRKLWGRGTGPGRVRRVRRRRVRWQREERTERPTLRPGE
jgi:hypothetical protein